VPRGAINYGIIVVAYQRGILDVIRQIQTLKASKMVESGSRHKMSTNHIGEKQQQSLQTQARNGVRKIYSQTLLIVYRTYASAGVNKPGKIHTRFQSLN